MDGRVRSGRRRLKPSGASGRERGGARLTQRRVPSGERERPRPAHNCGGRGGVCRASAVRVARVLDDLRLRPAEADVVREARLKAGAGDALLGHDVEHPVAIDVERMVLLKSHRE